MPPRTKDLQELSTVTIEDFDYYRLFAQGLLQRQYETWVHWQWALKNKNKSHNYTYMKYETSYIIFSILMLLHSFYTQTFSEQFACKHTLHMFYSLDERVTFMVQSIKKCINSKCCQYLQGIRILHCHWAGNKQHVMWLVVTNSKHSLSIMLRKWEHMTLLISISWRHQITI
jgi:hypothetical protein